MNRGIIAAGIATSIALAYVSILVIPYAFGAILLGIPLAVLNKRYSGILGFIVGFVSSFSLYLMYPLSSVSKLAGIVSRIIGLPSALILILFPIMFGLIGAVSALLFSGIRETFETRSGKETPDGAGKH